MVDNARITEILLEMKSSAQSLMHEPSDGKWHQLIEQYDMLFLGEKFNTIYAREMLHTLQEKYHLDIDLNELLDAIPHICAALHMQIEPMILLTDSGKPDAPIADYSIPGKTGTCNLTAM